MLPEMFVGLFVCLKTNLLGDGSVDKEIHQQNLPIKMSLFGYFFMEWSVIITLLVKVPLENTGFLDNTGTTGSPHCSIHHCRHKLKQHTSRLFTV